MKPIEVNYNDDHDYARETRAAKFTEFLFGKLIMILLKLSPRTVVIANVNLKGEFTTAINIRDSNSALITNCHIEGIGTGIQS